MSASHIRLIGLISLILVISLRFFFFFSNTHKFPNGTKLRISARISSEPIRYTKSHYLKLSGYKIYLPLYPRVFYGDRIVVEGIVDDGKLQSPKLVSIDENRGSLYIFRQKLVSFYENNLPKDHAALVAGVVIGSKSGIGEELWERLKNTGTAHVVVASGMNVTLITNFLLATLLFVLPRKKAVVFAFIGIWFYAILSGFDAPIVRAAIMSSGAFLAVGAGRTYSALRILFITILLMLFVKPVWVSDLGFWLSAIATFSIIVFSPYFKKKFGFLPNVIKEDWVTTISAQIGVVPLLYYYFGQFNVLSPFINTAILWTIVPLTIIGMIGGIIGTIIEPLGKIILYLCYPLTSWFLWVVSWF